MKRVLALCAVLALVLSACDSQAPITPQATSGLDIEAPWLSKNGDDPNAAFQTMLDDMNAALEENGENYRAVMVEWIAGPGSSEAGTTVFFRNVGNKQLSFDFVPFDDRRPWSGPFDGADDNITYLVDQVDAVAPPGIQAGATSDAIDRAMTTWDNETCSDLPIAKVPDSGIDWGFVAFLEGLGGSPGIGADIMHAGWGDIDFAGGVIGATFTFGFCDPCDASPVWTDIDNNGKADAAFREIYYDPSWDWAIDDNIDVETVALHEAGHGLSQAHFGKLFRTDANGKFHFAPRAVMNAGYTGVQQSIGKTDNAGHCSIWGSWPNN